MHSLAPQKFIRPRVKLPAACIYYATGMPRCGWIGGVVRYTSINFQRRGAEEVQQKGALAGVELQK